jgi:hypothetical protein
MRPLVKYGLIAIALIFLANVFFRDPAPSAPTTQPAAAVESTKTPHAADPQVVAVTVSKQLRAAMRDPDSYKLRHVLYVESTNSVCLDYQAHNGFGGTNQAHAVANTKTLAALTSDEKGFASFWNKGCTRSGVDLTESVIDLEQRMH